MSLLTIRRAITDSTGAVVPDATITVKNVATGVTNHTTSNAAGAYLFPGLVPATTYFAPNTRDSRRSHTSVRS